MEAIVVIHNPGLWHNLWLLIPEIDDNPGLQNPEVHINKNISISSTRELVNQLFASVDWKNSFYGLGFRG